MLNAFFKLEERKTNVKTEILAGITTFLSMAYILFVNPEILSTTGMPLEAVFVATAIAAAIGTLIMALYANYPVAQAPGMGMNAFFAFTVCGAMGYTFGQALFAIFCSGLVFMCLAASGIRELIINSIPSSLKYAVSAGIGMFIAFIGLKGAGIIVANESTFVSFGNITDGNTLLAIFGILFTLVLVARNTKAAIFIGMVTTAVVGVIFGLVSAPNAVVSSVPDVSPVFMKLFDFDVMSLLTDYKFIMVIFTVLFLDFFDTAGTLMGVATRAGLLDDEGKLINANKALMADATATTVGAMIGTSSVTSYAESVVGVESGGRTGLTALTVAVLFLFSLFFSPLLAVVTSSVTAPALVCVGALMMSSSKHIDFDDFADTTAAFLTMMFMILAYSIAEGIAVGFLTYVILKVAKGESKKVHPIMYGLAVLFIIYFVSKGL
ncbi:AGZA family xanthine/uracil permease-like MFS transporter [Bacilli bacterium PM5-3]|nr:AGZA family xanthine/uracil permease-like MFS transporter [Bacilli bacterium PM5-3]MDH6603222.1 AGZA family xanthine/uracil permease-like MFS transporter [Bacilli bacterium PM5-9]